MDIAELRTMAIRALKASPNLQFGDVSTYVETHLKPRRPLNSAEGVQLVQVLWELMLEGVLAPGHPGYVLQMPPFHVTEHGLECLKAEEVTPHDPDGFLQALRASAEGELDEIAMIYLEEALQCYRHREYLGAMVLLGVASERCVDLVAEDFLEGIADSKIREQKSRKLARSSRSTKRRFDTLRAEIEALPDLPGGLREGLDIHFDGIFEIIRRTRNDAGHPRVERPGKRDAHACLLLFPSYHKAVCELRQYLAARNA